ncbi:MAG: hypothetical protein F6K39_05775 [Okeania sp. SIO3B3]|nr:hypothetical protein [Okeania sp. SIO3B3]
MVTNANVVVNHIYVGANSHFALLQYVSVAFHRKTSLHFLLKIDKIYFHYALPRFNRGLIAIAFFSQIERSPLNHFLFINVKL